MRKVGPSGTIRALSAHFEEFACTHHEHDHFVVGIIGEGLQTFELGSSWPGTICTLISKRGSLLRSWPRGRA